MSISMEDQARQLAQQNYSIAIESGGGEEDGFVVSHPELPGCLAEGETLEEAIEFLQDATFGYILLLLEHGLRVPKPESVAVSTGSETHTIRRKTEVGDEDTRRRLQIKGPSVTVDDVSSRDALYHSHESNTHTEWLKIDLQPPAGPVFSWLPA